MKFNTYESSTNYFENLTNDLIPDSLPPQIKLIKRQGIYGFEVGNIVGVLPLNNNVILNILPKYKGINIIEMLLYVQGLNRNTLDNQTSEQYSVGKNEPMTQIFINAFIKDLKIIEESSMKFNRVKKRHYSNSVRGSVNWSKSKINLKRKVGNPLVSDVYQQSYSIPENILLSAAANVAIKYTVRFSEDWKLLDKWRSMFSQYELRKAMSKIDRKLIEDKIGGSRAYYKDAIISAKIILNFNGIEQGDTIEGDAILINTPTLYEDFIRVGCQNVFNSNDIFVSKGFPQNEYLFDNATTELVPDLVFRKGTKVTLVGDVKYKKPEPSDFHQLYTYAKKVQTSSGIIISPCTNGETKSEIELKTTFDNIKIYHISIPTFSINDLENSLILLKEKQILD